jgi:hypothetical protein
MFPVKRSGTESENESPESGILLEIWRTGGLIQTSVAISAGSAVDLEIAERPVRATVTCCAQDDYGFLLRLSVSSDQYGDWFPESYRPPYLRI